MHIRKELLFSIVFSSLHPASAVENDDSEIVHFFKSEYRNLSLEEVREVCSKFGENYDLIRQKLDEKFEDKSENGPYEDYEQIKREGEIILAMNQMVCEGDQNSLRRLIEGHQTSLGKFSFYFPYKIPLPAVTLLLFQDIHRQVSLELKNLLAPPGHLHINTANLKENQEETQRETKDHHDGATPPQEPQTSTLMNIISKKQYTLRVLGRLIEGLEISST